MASNTDKDSSVRARAPGTGSNAAAASAATPAAATAPAPVVPSKYAIGVKNVFQLPIVTLGVVLALYVGLRDDKWVWFDYHPLFMIIAWVSVASNAIMLKKIKGAENTRWHGYYMTLTAMLSLAGFYVIYTNKDMNGYPHFSSPHGQFGAVMVATMFIASIGSYVALNPDSGFARTNNFVRSTHKWFSRILIACGWYMCYEGLIKVAVDSEYVNMFAVCAICMVPVLLIF